jgi:diguanylate cyclase (GGDEF)-like protein
MPPLLQEEEPLHSPVDLTIPNFNEHLQAFIRGFADPLAANPHGALVPEVLLGDTDATPEGGRCWLAAGAKGCSVMADTPADLRSCYDCDVLCQALVEPIAALRENALILAHQLSTTIHGLREQAIRDPLTGVHNRRFLAEVFPPTASLARREGQTLWLLAADLDGLKRINDDLGHQAGDRALVKTARLLRQAVRASDHVFRMGGDEFLVLLVNCDRESAERVSDRVQDYITLYNASGMLPPEYPLALSIGACEYDYAEGLDASVATADARMYAEKRSRKVS